MKYIYKKIYKYVNEQHWTLGFIEQPVDSIVKGVPFDIHYLKGMPRNCWFADPFILDYDEQTIQLLVEEYNYKIRKGRIAKLVIDRNKYQLKDFSIILEMPTHLSFPFIRRIEDKVFIYPENSASDEWNSYKYDIATGRLSKERTIVNLPLTDAIISDIFGEPLIFATKLPEQNGNTLSVYSMEGELIQSVVFSSNTARNAGDWFVSSGKCYRPAQDCNGGYGRAVIIQEIQKQDGLFVFNDVLRIESTNPKFTTGCHTLNSYKQLSVVDVHGYKRPGIVAAFSFLKAYRK